MYSSKSTHFSELRGFLENIPVIESHDHFTAFQACDDPLDFIMDNYYMSDFWSAGGEEITGMGGYTLFLPIPKNLPDRERFDLFLRIYKKSCHTTYARAMREGLRICWGVKDITNYDEFLRFAEMYKGRDASIYNKTMEMMNIKAQIIDRVDLPDYIDGKMEYSAYCRFAFNITSFKDVHCKEDLMRMQRYLDRTICCLDDYMEAYDNYFQKALDFGIVCIKDVSAYRRPLSYGNPTKAEAEKAFNDMIFNLRDVHGDDNVRVLDDWLFHYTMRKAAKYHLPVQIHTGHMTNVRNDVRKANAALLLPALELHPDVQFDLFHANWPFMDEYLFMGKNYPNVRLDLCWAQGIDPTYCVELMKRAIMTVPHSKIFAFGGDTSMVEWVAGYLSIAKDNVAVALSDLVDSEWLTVQEAKQIALDWFFNNPNEFFKLGFEPITA